MRSFIANITLFLHCYILSNITFGSDETPSWRNTSECGLNSCYVMLRLAGVNCRYADLKQRIGDLPTEGYSALQLNTLLNLYNMNTAVVKCDYASLCQEGRLPAIVHSSRFSPDLNQMEGHFSVLLSCDSQKVSLIDGTTAEVADIKKEEFLKTWSARAIVPRRGATNWLSSPTLSMFLSAIAIWCISARRIPRLKRTKNIGTLTLSVLLGLWSTASASGQELSQIVRTVQSAQGSITSIDVRIQSISQKAKVTHPSSPLTREERFAFKNKNRLFERTESGGERKDTKIALNILGNKNFQQMTNGDFKVFGKREKCPEATFAFSTYEHYLGWDPEDPTIIDNQLRAQSLAMNSLATALNHVSSMEKTSNGLLRLRGTLNCKEIAEQFTPQKPKILDVNTDTSKVAKSKESTKSPIPVYAYEIVLDPAKAYAMVSRRTSLHGTEDEVYEIRNLEFQEKLPGVWLPTSGESVTRIKGKAPSIITWKTIDLQINNIPDSLFEQELVPSSKFIDMDSQLRDPISGGIFVQSVSAKPEAFDRSLKSVRRWQIFLGGNIFLLVVITATIAIRKYRQPTHQSNI